MTLKRTINLRHYFLVSFSLYKTFYFEDRVDNLLSKTSVEIKDDRSPHAGRISDSGLQKKTGEFTACDSR